MDIIELKSFITPPPIMCDNCGGSMRFVGSEPDPVFPTNNLLTYACTHCTHVQAMPFEAPGAAAGEVA